jgi:hypothetical protein
MKKCTEPNATHHAGCECHEARREAEIKRLEGELAKTSTLQQRLTIAEGTITDLRNEVAMLRGSARADRQIDAGHAMYRGGLLARIKSLETAAKAVIERWDSPLWKDAEPTAKVINQLRNTLNP